MPAGSASKKRATTSKSRRVTLAQLASYAGVSPATASFVMSDRQDQRISESTKQRVRDAAAELGYAPNLLARILQKGSSGTIALVSDFVSTTPYASATMRGALEAARSHDVLLFTAETLGDEELQQRVLEGLVGRQVDGFVYASMFTRVVTVPKQLRDRPLVLLNCVSDGEFDATSVIPDEVGAGMGAARALLDAGHRERIFFLGTMTPGWKGGAQWHEWAPLALPERLQGLTKELEKSGAALTMAPPLADWSPQEGRRAVANLLAEGKMPRALVCINDQVAFGAYQALSGAGLRIPNDVSVISFDDSEIAQWLEPPLTSVALPHEALGRAAVELLLGDGTSMGVRRLPMPITLRRSVGPPALD